jgi:methylmalonyl-CoA/ethylmalonyl-CoA epimerase
MQFDHIGVVVGSVARGRQTLREMFDIKDWTLELNDHENGVIVQFGRCGSGLIYELLQPLGDHSPVQTALNDRRAILNHVAYLVPDLAAARARLRLQGCVPTGQPKRAIAYGGKLIQFFMTPLYLLVELIEAPEHSHVFDWAALN